MSGHTPGPWEVTLVGNVTSPSRIVAHVTNPADALLIAAAPETAEQRDELLAALEALMANHQYQCGDSICDAARAAIARAKCR